MTEEENMLIQREVAAALKEMGTGQPKIRSRRDAEKFADKLMKYLGYQYHVEEVTGLVRGVNLETGYVIYMSREDISDRMEFFVIAEK